MFTRETTLSRIVVRSLEANSFNPIEFRKAKIGYKKGYTKM